MHKILFVCTGNYYRSRFAETYFNHAAASLNVPATAFSRGLQLNPEKNKGVISLHAETYLDSLNIPVDKTQAPARLETHDLTTATTVIVLDETEHRPMIRTLYPEWEEKVDYWKFEDDYILSPSVVLPTLKERVHRLVNEYHNKRSG